MKEISSKVRDECDDAGEGGSRIRELDVDVVGGGDGDISKVFHIGSSTSHLEVSEITETDILSLSQLKIDKRIV